ncbi:MAG TPA: spermidine/putrescine ABC transporter substrate-binding protein [Bryobacteraceae bacterium]|nr:spermidine/putrescine ABC transporter substrate-binding protein [Bryobacteraceae bacterium]
MTRRTLFLMGIAGATGCSRGAELRLNVFNWSDYVAPDTIGDFEKEFGVRVRYSTYESNEELLARVMGGNSGWDVIFPSSYLIPAMREYGLLLPLDHQRLSHLGNVAPLFRQPVWDPALEHGVPYMWGGTGIAYNRSLFPAPEAWADLWSTRLAGKLTMLDDPVEVFGACLKKVGYSVNSTNVQHLRSAAREAIAQKPLVRAYVNAEVRDQLVAGDVLASQLWSPTAQQAMDASPNLAFSYPSEGFNLYADNSAILRESKRPELAHSFVNYLLRAEVSAAVALSTRTATANGAARELLPEAFRSHPVLYPSQETLQRGEWITTPTPAVQRLRDRLWTEIKSS